MPALKDDQKTNVTRTRASIRVLEPNSVSPLNITIYKYNNPTKYCFLEERLVFIENRYVKART